MSDQEPSLDTDRITDAQPDALIARALSAFPDGTYLMTSGFEGDRAGVLVHSVLPASMDPPMIVVAARKGHAIDPIIRDARCFAVGLVRPDDKLIRKRFRFADTAASARAESNNSDVFDPFPDRTLATGAPILERCPVWLDCEIARHIDLESDYELFVGLIVAARIDDSIQTNGTHNGVI